MIYTVTFKPFLIKPNIHELGELFDAKPETVEEVISYAEQLRSQGAQNNGDYELALKRAVCAGSASAFGDGLTTKEDIEALMKKI